MLLGMFIGYALNSGGRLDDRELARRSRRKNTSKDSSPKKFESKVQVAFVFLCAGVLQRLEGHAQRQTLRNHRVESFDAVRCTLYFGRGDRRPFAMRKW